MPKLTQNLFFVQFAELTGQSTEKTAPSSLVCHNNFELIDTYGPAAKIEPKRINCVDPFWIAGTADVLSGGC